VPFAAPGQRISGALEEAADAVAPEPFLVDFEIGPEQKLGWQLLDGKPNGIRGTCKSPV